MKIRSLKRFSLCILIVLMGICLLPVPARAEDPILLSSFEELKEACAVNSTVTGAFLCTSAELVISEDIEIPTYMTISFRNFTVPEGVTMTVKEQAEIRTYAFTVQGNLINRGKVVQQDLSEPWAADKVRLFALIPGHVENKGEMILTDVFGKGNINRFGGRLIIYETALYEETRKIVFGDEAPVPAIEAVNTPSLTPVPPENGTVHRIFDILENAIPKLAFFLVLVCSFFVVKTGIFSSRKDNRRKQGTVFADAEEDLSHRNDGDWQTASDLLDTSAGEDHFQRDKRKRIEQLDDWLKNGLIDRREYKELKRRYLEDL